MVEGNRTNGTYRTKETDARLELAIAFGNRVMRVETEETFFCAHFLMFSEGLRAVSTGLSYKPAGRGVDEFLYYVIPNGRESTRHAYRGFFDNLKMDSNSLNGLHRYIVPNGKRTAECWGIGVPGCVPLLRKLWRADACCVPGMACGATSENGQFFPGCTACPVNQSFREDRRAVGSRLVKPSQSWSKHSFFSGDGKGETGRRRLRIQPNPTKSNLIQV